MSIIPGAAGGSPDPEKIPIIVGGEIDYPPYSFLDTGGEPAGFQVELTRAIAGVMGLDIEIRLTPWPEARRALEDGTADIIPGMFYSEERTKIFDFSPPFSINSVAIFARRNSPPVSSIGELRNKEIILMRGEAMHDYVLTQRLSDRLVLTETPADALRVLASGKGDYALVAQMPGFYWIKELKLSNIISVGPPLEPFKNCFAVRKGNMLLLSRFTEGLNILKQTGKYQKLYEKWLGVLEPRGITLAAALQYAAAVFIPLLLLLAGAFFWSWSLRKKVGEKTAELQRQVILHRQAEEALKVSEAESRALLQIPSTAIMLLDTGACLLDVNETFERRFGRSKEQVIGTCLWDLLPPHVAALRQGYFAQALSTRAEVRWEDERQGLWGDNSVIPLLDESGAVTRLIGFAVDITEAKKNQFALQESEQKYRSLFERSDAILMYESESYRCIDVNKNAEALYGFSREELLAMKAYDLSAEHEETMAALHKAAEGDSVFIPLRYHRRKDGTVFPCEIRAGAFMLGGRSVVFGIVHDITGRKKSEEKLAASLRGKEVLLREVHHRTKNNMQVISGLLSLQLKYAYSENLAAAFADIQSRIRSMALVHEMLYKSQDISFVNLGEYIQALAASLLPRGTAAEKAPALSFDLDSVIVSMESAVPCGLALNEILTNIVKHAFPGGKEGSVVISLHAGPGNEIHIAVKDDGVGMPEHYDIDTGGTLGMTLIRNLVEFQLQGRLELQAGRGTGTLVTIIFTDTAPGGEGSDG